jgi:hypothetical protein
MFFRYEDVEYSIEYGKKCEKRAVPKVGAHL